MNDRNTYDEEDRGWVCPKCDSPISPDLMSCPFCVEKKTNVITLEVCLN